MKVVLPEPDGPTRKTNSPLSISTVQSWRATVDPLYVLVTFWNVIMGCVVRGRRQRSAECSGDRPAPTVYPLPIGRTGSAP